LPADVLIAGIAPGLISVALLTVNNLRDVDGDRKAGKRTLPVRFGKGFAKAEFLLCLVGACVVVPFVLYAMSGKILMLLVGIIFIYIGVYSIRVMYTYKDPAALNGVLARTGALLLIFSVLFSAAWISGR